MIVRQERKARSTVVFSNLIRFGKLCISLAQGFSDTILGDGSRTRSNSKITFCFDGNARYSASEATGGQKKNSRKKKERVVF